MIQNIDIHQDVGQDDNRALEDGSALEVGCTLEVGCALEDDSALQENHEVHADRAIHSSLALDSIALDSLALDSLALNSLVLDSIALSENQALENNLAGIIDDAIENEPDIGSGYASGRQSATKPNYILILASIFKSTSVHIVFVLFIIYFSNFGGNVFQSHSESTSSPIKATLYFPPVPKAEMPMAEIPKTEDAIELVNEELRIEETVIEEAVIEETATQETVIEEIMEEVSEQADQIPAIIEQALPNQPQETLETESDNSQSSPMTSSVQSQSSSSSRVERRNQALSSHLNQLQETQIQQMSQNALRNKDQIFYEQQTQGLKYDPQRFNSDIGGGLNNSNLEYMEQMHLTGIEMSAAHQSQLKPTTVDCSSTSGKVAQTMSFFMGGRVSCTPKPEFQKYIDARLNKNQK